MTRPSSIDQLPEEIRSEIGRLLIQGATIDRIVEHLRGLVGTAPSRSAVGRYKVRMDKVAERMRRSRDVATVLVQEMGDQPASKTVQLNIELLHSVIFDLFNHTEDGTDIADGAGLAALQGNPEGVMMLAKAMDHLTRASKTDIEHVRQLEERAEAKARKAAAAAVEVVGKREGVSAATIDAIKKGVFGVGS